MDLAQSCDLVQVEEKDHCCIWESKLDILNEKICDFYGSDGAG